MLGSRRSAPRLLLVLGVVAVAVGRVVGPAGRLVGGPHRELFRRKVDVALGRFGHELVLVVRDVVIDEKGMLIWPALLAPVAPELLIERSRLAKFLGREPVVRYRRRVHPRDLPFEVLLGIVGFFGVERVIRVGHHGLLRWTGRYPMGWRVTRHVSVALRAGMPSSSRAPTCTRTLEPRRMDMNAMPQVESGNLDAVRLEIQK